MLKRSTHCYVALCIAFAGFTQSAGAAMIGAQEIAQAAPAQAVEQDAHARLQQILDRPDVRAELVRQGVDPAMAAERAAALSPEQAEQLAQNIESAPAGGIIGAILLVFFVLLLTDILGLTKVFPFTRPIR